MTRNEDSQLRRRAFRIVRQYRQEQISRMAQAIVDKEGEFGAHYGNGGEDVLEHYYHKLSCADSAYRQLRPEPQTYDRIAVEWEESELGLEADINAWIQEHTDVEILSLTQSEREGKRFCLLLCQPHSKQSRCE